MKPNPLRSMLAASALAAAALPAAVLAAELTLFKQPNFAGGELTLRGDTTNLTGAGFQDQVSSVIVKSGRWQVCTQPDFKGDCSILERGEYPTLQQSLNHRIESARELTQTADRGRDREERYGTTRYPDERYRGDRYADNRGYGGRYSRGSAVELFTAQGFRGRMLPLDRDEDNLDDRLDRGIASLLIREGRWQLCTQPGYRGVCEVYEPGRYDDLGRLGQQISSARRIG
jgi:hypothetical protein